MSDEMTLLPCPFCGGEAEIIEADYGMYMTGYAVYCKKCCLKLGVTGRLGETYEWSPVFNTESEAITAWNTRAAHGTLTAEQVRETIKRYSTELLGGHRVFIESDWQAIADKLNAELGSGTCRNVSEYAEERNHFECSECGCTVKDAEDYWVSVHGHGCNDFIPWRFCPNCGAKVVTP